jgi:hypothetical protein
VGGGGGGNKRILQPSIHSLSQARKRSAVCFEKSYPFLFRFLFVVWNQTLSQMVIPLVRKNTIHYNKNKRRIRRR